MADWFSNGGPVLWVILSCSIVALAIFLERLVSLKKPKIIPATLLDTVHDLVSQKKLSEAEILCKQDPSPLSKILHVGIRNANQPRDRIKENIEETGKKEVLHMSKRVGALGTIAHISPLLGLLGTVLGMMNVFQVITEKGVGNAQSLAGGISQALITTVAGLIVAIPTLVAYRYLTARVKAYVTEIEEHSLRLTDTLAQGGPRG